MNYPDNRRLLSYGAPLSMIEGDRKTAKSFEMWLTAFRGAKRRGAPLPWVRRTEREAVSLLQSFGETSKFRKLEKMCHIEDFKTDGSTGLIKKGGEWLPAVKIIPLSGWTACRDAEDKAKLIFFDEAFTTPEKHRLFRGNEVEAFLDLWHSYKREPGDNVRALLTGNRESAVNIYLTYFGVEKKPPLLENRVFLLKDGAIAFEYRFNHEKEKKMDALLSGTRYGAFLHGSAKGEEKSLLCPISKNARFYFCVDFLRPVTFWAERLHIFKRGAAGKPRALRQPGSNGNWRILPPSHGALKNKNRVFRVEHPIFIFQSRELGTAVRLLRPCGGRSIWSCRRYRKNTWGRFSA